MVSAVHRMMWRTLAGNCQTTLLAICSGSERDLPATLESLQTMVLARSLETWVVADRRPPSCTLDKLDELVRAVQSALPTHRNGTSVDDV